MLVSAIDKFVYVTIQQAVLAGHPPELLQDRGVLTVDEIEHRPLDYPKICRLCQARTRKPVRFGTCCSQVMGLFLDIHTPKYKDKREVLWDMAVAMNQELRALRDAGCRAIQVEEPTLHFWANTYGPKSEEVKFMVEAYNREVQGLEDVEIWIHTCWGNPNMQRVIENDSYREFQLYLEACRGDVWTVEMKDRNMREIELFAPLKGSLKKSVGSATPSEPLARKWCSRAGISPATTAFGELRSDS